jgi:hypothetical protein
MDREDKPPRPAAKELDPLITVREIAELAGVTASAVRDAMDHGRLRETMPRSAGIRRARRTDAEGWAKTIRSYPGRRTAGSSPRSAPRAADGRAPGRSRTTRPRDARPAARKVALPFAELLSSDLKPEARAKVEEALAAAAVESTQHDLAKTERWKVEQARALRDRMKVEALVDGLAGAGPREQAVAFLREKTREAIYARVSDLQARLAMMVVLDSVLAELSDAVVLFAAGRAEGSIFIEAYARASETTKWQQQFRRLAPGSTHGSGVLVRIWLAETKRLYISRATAAPAEAAGRDGER